jgi:hypothetical protein
MRYVTIIAAICLMATSSVAQTISFTSGPVNVGSGLQSETLSLQLSDSQHGGIFVSVTSNDSTLALVAADQLSIGSRVLTRFIPNGTTYHEFVVQALEGVTGFTTLTASAPDFTSDQLSVEVDIPRFEIYGLDTSTTVPSPDNEFLVRVGRPMGPYWNSGERMRVGGPGVSVSFTNSDPLVAEFVTSSQTGQAINLNLFGGQKTTGPNIATGGIALRQLAGGTTNVTVNMPGFAPADSNYITVNIDEAKVVYLGMPVVVGAGLRTNGVSIGVNGSDHGGTTIDLVSTDPNKALISTVSTAVGQESTSVFIPDGEMWGVFYVHGLEGVEGIAPIEASAPGFLSVTEGAIIVTPGMETLGLVENIDTLDPNDPFSVRVGIINEVGSALAYAQNVRPGSSGLDVAVICNNPAVGLLETSADLSDTAWVHIDPLTSNSPSNVAAGGVAFDGVGVGTAMVHSEIDGFLPTVASISSVEVTQPGITIIDPSGAGVGAGLQNPIYVYLGSSDHGGVTLHVEVEEPELAIISQDPQMVGSSGFDIEVPNGETFFLLYLQGIENQTGPVHVVATAPGFSAITLTTELRTPTMTIAKLDYYHSTLNPLQSTIALLDVFVTQIGVSADGISLSPQTLRAGSPGIDVTAMVDDPLLGQFATAVDTSAVLSVRIESGQSRTSDSLATGGIAFDALSPGDVQVSVSAPGYGQLPAAIHVVTVIPAAIQSYSWDPVGAGLVTAQRYVELNGAGHGGITVHLEVDDPSLGLVSSDSPVPGEAAADIFVPHGNSRINYRFHGLEDVEGTVTLTATAPDLMIDDVPVSAQFTHDVVQPVVEIFDLGSTLDVSGHDDVFSVRVGLPTANNSSVRLLQLRRPGSSPLVATVTCNDPAVATIISLSGSDASQDVLVNPGYSSSPLSVVQGGLALRGEDVGSVLVAVDLPGFMLVGSSTHEVFITQNGIALPGVPAALGAGLQSDQLVARLSDGAHNGTNIKITTNIPGSVLVSQHAHIAGGDTLLLHVPAGQLDAVFHLQALENTLGTITVKALIDGNVTGIRDMEVVQPAIAVTQLADTLLVTDGPDAFVLEVGVSMADLSGLALTQVVRAQSAPLVCPVILEDGVAADLVTQSATADSVDVVIAAGEFQSAATVSAGGVALFPVADGLVTVTARPTGYLLTDAASQLVFISENLSPAGNLPRVTQLHGNHPNPFNPVTHIAFSLSRAAQVKLDVYDIRGNRVRSLIAGNMQAGEHTIEWDGTDDQGRVQAAGIYLVQLHTPDQIKSHKMALVK